MDNTFVTLTRPEITILLKGWQVNHSKETLSIQSLSPGNVILEKNAAKVTTPMDIGLALAIFKSDDLRQAVVDLYRDKLHPSDPLILICSGTQCSCSDQKADVYIEYHWAAEKVEYKVKPQNYKIQSKNFFYIGYKDIFHVQ